MNSPYVSLFRSELELLSVILMWGINFPLIKVILEVMPPFVLNIFRITAAGLVLGYIHLRRSKWSFSTFWAPLRTDTRAFISISFVGWILYQIAFITGLNMTDAGNAAIIMASSPIWTALLARIMGVDRLSKLSWFGLFVSIMGTSTIVVLGSAEISLSSELLMGNAIVLAAAVFWGSYTAMTKPMVAKHSPLPLTVISLLIALPLLLVFSIPYWKLVDWSLVTGWYWVAIFFSGSLSTGIAIVFWNNSVRKLGASHTAAFGNMVPLVALFSSYFMLGNEIIPAQLIGGTLIIGGLVVMRWELRRSQKNEPIPTAGIL
ncbi:MAG: DMT family transporter [Bacteroidetes bacterium]|nr:DMT family transporter [Bacteroidota bacterium]